MPRLFDADGNDTGDWAYRIGMSIGVGYLIIATVWLALKLLLR